MTGQYASQTAVPSDRSRAEIERTLRRYGADEFVYATSNVRALIGFTAQNRQIRFELALPDPKGREFHLTPTGRDRSASAAEEAYEQAVRQKWRALALMVKAKLEAVESGIVTFEQEFLPHVVLPGGESVYSAVAPRLEQAYATGRVGSLLQLGDGS